MMINFLKGDAMKNLFQFKRVSLLSVLFVAGLACAQSQGEPIQAPDELTLGGFEGCTIAPPKDGCAARIKCSGVGRIFGTSPYAVQDATKEAQAKARAQLAKFYSEKVRASESSGQSNASGGADVKESFSRAMAEVTQTSADAVLSGFQILGRQVDMAQKTVTIKGGVSCKSQAAAAQSQAASSRSAPAQAQGAQAPAAQPQNQGPSSTSVGPSNMKTLNQKVKNADEF